MTSEQMLHRNNCLEYLGERTGTYEWRCLRYAAAWDRLLEMGLRSSDLIVDVGAGMCDFDRYARQVRNFDGRILPVDGAIDGTDLNVWTPPYLAEFFVCLELIEHLEDPFDFLERLSLRATRGIVLTTPNPEVVDVLAIDRTHLTPVSGDYLMYRGYRVAAVRLFGKDKDTLLAWKGVNW